MPSDPIETLPGTLTSEQAILLLARDPRDACALVSIYESHHRKLRESATRWFGKNSELRNKAINSILAAIARQARSYDPQSMDPGKWIHQCAGAEARRLREALDTAGKRGPRTRRAM
jgi:hypothetical protein